MEEATRLFGNSRINEKELIEEEIMKKSIKFIPWIELSNISKLDEGHFGLIIKAYWTKSHNYVVCKTLTNMNDINDKYYAAFIHELTMQTRSDLCENIIRFLGVTKGVKEEIIFGTPEEYMNLYSKCWDDNPHERPDADSVYDELCRLLERMKNFETMPNIDT
ncbi:1161_t:CDS:2, partial [Scutellospora calospora]